MKVVGQYMTVALVIVSLGACSSSSKKDAAPSSAPENSSVSVPATVSEQDLKDPCTVLTMADARALLAIDYDPAVQTIPRPSLGCFYSTSDGSEVVSLQISTAKLSAPKTDAAPASSIAGLGDTAFVIAVGRNAVVAWSKGGVSYQLSWTALATATRSAVPDQVAALAHTIADQN